MTTSVLDRVPLDEITAQARQVRFGRSLLTLIAAVLFGIGFCVAKVFAVAFLAAAWSWTALRVGFEAAHGPTRGQELAALREEVEHLRSMAARG